MRNLFSLLSLSSSERSIPSRSAATPSRCTASSTPTPKSTSRGHRAPPGHSGHSTLSYALPADFNALLRLPLEQALDALLPVHPPPYAHVPQGVVSTATHPFIDAMASLPDARTENDALAHSTTGSALVDLMFEFTPGVQPARPFLLLDKAWSEDPAATVKSMFHARSIHEGKGFKDGFFRAMAWLWEKHPRTMLENLHLLVDPTCARHRDRTRDLDNEYKHLEKQVEKNGKIEEKAIKLPEYPARPHGTFDDLNDILILAINGQLTIAHTGPLSAIDEALAPAWQAEYFKAARLKNNAVATPRLRGAKGNAGRTAHDMVRKHVKAQAGVGLAVGIQKEIWNCGTNEAKHFVLHRRLLVSLQHDKKFQALYLTVTHLFVDHLRADLDLFAQHRASLSSPAKTGSPFLGESSPFLFGMSYAAKWTASPAKSADRQLCIATAISLLLFPEQQDGEGWKVARLRLQKEVLAPLRAALKVPEVKMGAGTWSIDYSAVPAKAMSRYLKLFMQHDPTGFEAYLRDVETGRRQIAGASLFPHEILIDAIDSDQLVARVANLQWRKLVTSISSSNDSKLKNCLAIADVSGSMGFYEKRYAIKKTPYPIFPCLALTLLLGELAEEPWRGSFFTFSADPEWVRVNLASPLSERARSLSTANWGLNTAYWKVFDMILQAAIKNRLRPDQMVKKLFVFSDMQFDRTTSLDYRYRTGQWRPLPERTTEHELIKAKFAKAGYTLPELVYWNLAARNNASQPQSKPVQAKEEGVTLVSGFSGALMKFFLREQDAGADSVADNWEKLHGGDGQAAGAGAGRNPEETTKRMLNQEAFDGVKVVD